MNKVKVGVIGGGLIAQTMHIPYLRELEDKYQIQAVCDLSEKLVNKVADYYNIPKRFTDYRKLLEENIDAVLILTYLHSDEAIAAAQAGKHILVEKPVATNVQEVDKMISAAKENKVTLMVAHMQRYDPGYEYASSIIKEMEDIKLIRLHTVIGPNDSFINDIYRIWRFDDIPEEEKQKYEQTLNEQIKEAIGEVPEHVRRAYRIMLGLSTHDMTILRGMFGNPKKVLNTEIWNGGTYYSTTLSYGDNKRCIFDTGLTKIKKVDKVLEVFSDDLVAKVEFTSPFLKNAPTYVHIWKMEGDIYFENKVLVSYDMSFKRELVHFHDCINTGEKARTDAYEAREDLVLFKNMVGNYLRAQ